MTKINREIQNFQFAIRNRNELWDPQNKLTPLFFATELAGEVGEACNIVKKIERKQHGLTGSTATLEELKSELEDVIICTLLLANSFGLFLAPTEKFNATSRKLNLPEIEQ